MDIDIENQLNSKTAQVIIYISENPNKNLKQISQALNIDYNFISKIVKRCEEKGIMNAKLISREKQTEISGKGEKIATYLKNIEKLI